MNNKNCARNIILNSPFFERLVLDWTLSTILDGFDDGSKCRPTTVLIIIMLSQHMAQSCFHPYQLYVHEDTEM